MHLTLKTWYPYHDQVIITLPQLTIVATFRIRQVLEVSLLGLCA
ncbi:hypothetical protein [Synechocystis sp. PCC 7509]|jgi:hypothetical protein|nr:hypothetical protein [Synechocystis sp. PCC 7509]